MPRLNNNPNPNRNRNLSSFLSQASSKALSLNTIIRRNSSSPSLLSSSTTISSSLISLLHPNTNPNPKTTKSTSMTKTSVPLRRSSVRPALVSSRVLPLSMLSQSPCTRTTYNMTLSSLQNKKKKKKIESSSHNISFSIEQALFFEPFLLSPSLFSHLIQQGDVKSN
eukprot:CAMPEP_0170990126 /NCGR_PEP_ID=MMETSP0736-20130129/8339_1 /TAXON_ID=186038 /ORGANISM="Fragilariopsis kerguelensis, Strain L26-C5" /LENGTH=166 /DNA_ID=CAMNT_0011415087 /DNA_START=483 /DNA_END=983 /DNA_ORIENTATION=-